MCGSAKNSTGEPPGNLKGNGRQQATDKNVAMEIDQVGGFGGVYAHVRLSGGQAVQNH